MNLIQELNALQEARGHLGDDDLRDLARRLGVALAEVQGVASFYPHYRRTPPPQLRVSACRDLSCRMNGAEDAATALATACAARGAEFERVSCLGRCDAAPACLVNDVPVRASEVAELLEDPERIPEDEPTSAPRRWDTDPYESPEEHYGVLRQALADERWGDEEGGVVARLEASGLRGMGGAGFPTGRKWGLVRAEPGPDKYVVCNADESEPGTFKDRVILEELPHLVIEGMLLAARCVGAQRGFVYIRHEYRRERRSLERAIEAAYAAGVLGERVCGSDFAFDLEIFVSPGGYILGEETALLEALEGRRGEPRNKPPYPGVSGLFGAPTLINNVETLAHVPRTLQTGTVAFKFFSVSGDVSRPGVCEVPVGTTTLELIERCGGMREGARLAAFLPGGPSTPFLGAEQADVALDWEPLKAAGSALGSGAVVVLSEDADLLDAAENLTAFFRNESCGKCVPCRLGTERAVRLIEARGDLGELAGLDETLRDTSLCGLGHVALVPIRSLLARFPECAPGGAGGR